MTTSIDKPSSLSSSASCTLHSIYTCPTAGGEMQAQTDATLTAGVGIHGDRYASHQGTYSVLPEPGRQVTLLSATEVDAAFKQEEDKGEMSNIRHQQSWQGHYGTLRRNLVVQGPLVVAADESNDNSILQTKDTVGRGIKIGNQGVLLFVHRQCVPCVYNEKKNQRPGLMETLWNAAGVNCEILQGGRIQVGDAVQVLTRSQLEASLRQGDAKATVPMIDPGEKTPGFFVPPRERTAEMVKQGLEGRKRAYEKYSVQDPVGSARATSSFASVGLSFWPSSCTTSKK